MSQRLRFHTAATAWLPGLGCLLLATAAPAVFADDTPVVASLAVSPVPASEGEIIELKLKIAVAGAWHVYGNRPGAEGQQPMSLKLKRPEGVELIGGWVWPANAHLLRAGEHVFTHRLKLSGLKGKATVDVTVMYQACDPRMCLPPEVLLLEVEVAAAAAAHHQAHLAGVPASATALDVFRKTDLAARRAGNSRYPRRSLPMAPRGLGAGTSAERGSSLRLASYPVREWNRAAARRFEAARK